jgi:hypothetical protein
LVQRHIRAEPVAGDSEHVRAQVDPGHRRASPDEFLSV